MRRIIAWWLPSLLFSALVWWLVTGLPAGSPLLPFIRIGALITLGVVALVVLFQSWLASWERRDAERTRALEAERARHEAAMRRLREEFERHERMREELARVRDLTAVLKEVAKRGVSE